ncbi:PTS sugar transporter subunit IIC [Schleiferilactobacillus perolens]|uniref:Permease IIC component n=1 Tax=Schleiferilactobacillus perolens DSM 12744 TaxID=1423792 RepID=A0A0R1N2E2_9LACO|nr:PTS transporter subunit EIIC [Schleiferilactobacillus perolens]KRL14486.1 PTS family beta-glucoside [Schleiferilactobacillus perolens DSM 12744]
MKKLEDFLSRFLMPMTEKLQKNKILAALMEGFIRTSPITLEIAFITIIGNFPLPGWSAMLTRAGLLDDFQAITNGATGVFSLYVVYSLAFSYAKQLGANERNSALISLASFIMLMPQSIPTIAVEHGKNVEKAVGALKLDFLGGQGLFLGMIVALVVTRLYAYLSTKKLMLKLPDSVPPMVTQSLAPIFVVTIIFTLTLLVRIGFGLTGAGDIFNWFVNTINAPLNKLVASPLSIILIVELLALLWFFGIHNAVLQGPLGAISMAMVVGNITAFQAGKPLPYLTPSVIYMGMYASGFMGFVTFFMIKCRSAKFKQLGKLAFIPSLFNITEPIMFGVPIMFNPIFFIPQVFTQLIAGFVTWGLTATILPITLNPTMSLLPWTTPTFIKMPLSGGLNYAILMVISMAIGIIMWYPFLRIADKREYALEMAAAAEQNTATSEVQA